MDKFCKFFVTFSAIVGAILIACGVTLPIIGFVFAWDHAALCAFAGLGAWIFGCLCVQISVHESI